MLSKFTKDKLLFPISYSKFSYSCIQTPLLLLLSLSPFHSLYSQQHKFSLFQSSFLHWSCAPPKLSPPLKFYSPKTLSSIEDLSSPHEGMALCLKACVWVWCLKEWICLVLGMISRRELSIFIDFEFSLGLGMVSQRKDLMFEIVGFIVLGNKMWWVWYLWGFECFLFCLEIEL